MAETNLSPSSPPASRTSSSPKREDIRPMGAKIAELNESQSELLTRLQGLKTDLQDWRSKLDTQVMTYKEELIELKKTLNTDLEQLKSELRATLQQQQEDISDSLRNLGLEDLPEGSKKPEAKDNVDISDKTEASLLDSTKETSSGDGGIAVLADTSA